MPLKQRLPKIYLKPCFHPADFPWVLRERYAKRIASYLLTPLFEEGVLASLKEMESGEYDVAFIEEGLPVVHWSFPEKFPGLVTVTLLCKHREGAARFFEDMVHKWLVQGDFLSIESSFKLDLAFSENLLPLFTLSSLSFSIAEATVLKEIMKKRAAVEAEIRLGVTSSYHAKRILEFKGLSQDEKVALIQEKIGALIHKREEGFDEGLISYMRKFLVNSSEEFKKQHDPHHMSRIISILHLLHKLLLQKIRDFPDRRHVIVKLLKTDIENIGYKKSVLGVVVGLNFVHDNERFEEKHLVKCLNKLIPGALVIENSGFIERGQEAKEQVLYLEIERANGEDFSLDEVKRLKNELPDTLKGYIESWAHPVFMPRNAEEILRNIMILSDQLRFVQDIPQMVISFDKQDRGELSFTIVLLRIIKEDSLSAAHLLNEFKGSVRLVEDRIRSVGLLRKRYQKEAIVFRLFIPEIPFLREDGSIDAGEARRFVVKKIEEVFGAVRDYNGGLICKQHELLLCVKNSLGNTFQDSSLLEKFFYGIHPMEMRSMLAPSLTKTFFFAFLRLIKKGRLFRVKEHFFIKQDSEAIFAVAHLPEDGWEKKVQVQMEERGFSPISCLLSHHDEFFVGWMLVEEEREKKQRFLDYLEGLFIEEKR